MRHGLGVENLQGSGMIAGETSQAYQDTFTISLVMNALQCINASIYAIVKVNTHRLVIDMCLIF